MTRTLKESLRLWLLAKPRAVSLRVTCGGKVSTVAVVPNQSWAQIAGSLEAMEPELIETLDANGNVGRAVRTDQLGDDDAGDDSQATPAPAPAQLDAESQRFTLVANLLSQAHQKSFDALVELANANARRAEALERTVSSYERMRAQELAEREDALADREEQTNQSPLQQIAQAALGGMGMAGGMPAPTPPPPTKPTNGKA